jgi:hypothetical protein
MQRSVISMGHKRLNSQSISSGLRQLRRSDRNSHLAYHGLSPLIKHDPAAGRLLTGLQLAAQ